jgi:hypothetical protein
LSISRNDASKQYSIAQVDSGTENELEQTRREPLSYHIPISIMAQSFPYFTSSSTPPPSSRIPSTSQIQQQSISGSSKRDSTLPSSTSTQNVNVNVNRQSSLHQQLFASQQHGGILDRPLNRSKGSEVSSGAWAFLFGEIVSYSQSRVDSVTDLEKR